MKGGGIKERTCRSRGGPPRATAGGFPVASTQRFSRSGRDASKSEASAVAPPVPRASEAAVAPVPRAAFNPDAAPAEPARASASEFDGNTDAVVRMSRLEVDETLDEVRGGLSDSTLDWLRIYPLSLSLASFRK